MKVKVYLEPWEDNEPERSDRFFLGHADTTELIHVVDVLNTVGVLVEESEFGFTFETIDFEKDVRFMLLDEAVCLIRVNV
jgi:hypothetical protein